MSPDYRMAALLGFPLTNSSANHSRMNHAVALDFSGGGGGKREKKKGGGGGGERGFFSGEFRGGGL